jgi:hypothetical protein
MTRWAALAAGWAATTDTRPVEAHNFHRAAELVLDAASALRAGDALHLACAEAVRANCMATLDGTLGRNAQRLKMKLVARRDTHTRVEAALDPLGPQPSDS